MVIAIPAPNSELKFFNSGVQNLLDDTLIAGDAASDSKNWYTQDGRIKLVPGRVPVGTEGSLGKNTGQKFGYRTDGVLVHWAKMGTKIQYLNSSGVWTDCITGLTENADYFMANYSSLAGAFTVFIGPDGIFLVSNACPQSYLPLYSSTKNFKFAGGLIDKGRMIAWGRTQDKTGLYGSYIDAQNSTVYTTVSAEATTASSGFLKAISPGAVTVTVASPAVFTLVAHGLTAGTPIRFTTTGTLPTGLTVGTLYYVIAAGLTADAFEVSLTLGGAAVVTTGTQSGVHTVYRTTRNAFGILLTLTGTGEVFTDTYLGTLTGSLGSTGTINYLTGAYTLSVGGTGTVNYQWQDMTVHGIADFTHTATRVAAEGFQFPQDDGGDPILCVVVGLDGNYYTAKKSCFYALSIGADDVTADNNVYRRDIGIQSPRAICPTQFGIVFMNTANPSKPQLTILQRNPVGGEVEPTVLFSSFKFANYYWDDAAFDVYERYITIACRTLDSALNDTILLGNPSKGTMSVDITAYGARTFARNNSGDLFIGSPVTTSVYNVYNGIDDNGDLIENFWTGRGELFQPPVRKGHYYPTSLKKHRKLRFKGLIAVDQYYAVYVDYDDTGPQLIGTVRGDASYVDYGAGVAVGQSLVGAGPVGGDTGPEAFPYFVELRIKKPPKFLKRKITFKALGFGYVDINYQNDWGLMFFEDKLPTRFRQKQNVSLDGKTTNLPTPEF